jgi:hypothetical protein
VREESRGSTGSGQFDRSRGAIRAPMRLLRSLFGSRSNELEEVTPSRATAPSEIASAAGSESFRIIGHLWGHEGLPILGEALASLLEKELTQGWYPDPRRWTEAVEHAPQ